MALIQCRECKQTISDMALFCPICGWPTREVLATMKGKTARSRLRFNPLIRPGKFRLIFGGLLVYGGEMLSRNPKFLGEDFMLMGKKINFDPQWLYMAGGFLIAWALLRAFYWGCSQCGSILPAHKSTRCPFCLHALSKEPT
ncbi:MAG: hypothetical protein G8345_11155 [Magnetococcales bacterium]|nr:hypothetical protein [Magnetococcales bacterium]